MTDHTPAPWSYCGDFVRAGDGLYVIAQCYSGCDTGRAEARANARLIAAAPEMLAALEHCLNFIANTEGELGITLDSGDAARAAIAKAKGVRP